LGLRWGLIAYVLVFVLPELAHMVETMKLRVEFTTIRLIGYVGMLVAYVCLAGVVAILVGGADHAREAIAYGMGWEAIVKGLGSAGAAAAAAKMRVSN
jgi:type II secretory pathway component PulF